MSLGLTVVLVLLTFIASAIIFVNSLQKDIQKELKEFDDILKDKMLEPRYRIVFKVNGFLKFTSYSEASVISYYHGVVASSKDVAKILMEKSYQRGFFEDADGITYPTCKVDEAEIKQER